MKLSFICVSNNQEMFDKYIVPSLQIQKNRDFEIIRVDSASKSYSSATAALNEGAARAKGEYLVFLHHDIVLENPDFIDEMLAMIEGREFYVAGVAGSLRQGHVWKRKVVSNIVHGEHRSIPGKSPVTEIRPVCTVDECFFIIPRRIYQQHAFLEIMPTWHLYAVEYCLWAHTQAKEGCVLMLPLRLWHLSKGESMSKDYYAAARKLRHVYRMDMFTTVGAWPNNRILFEIRVVRDRFRRYRQKMKKLRRARNENPAK